MIVVNQTVDLAFFSYLAAVESCQEKLSYFFLRAEGFEQGLSLRQRILPLLAGGRQCNHGAGDQAGQQQTGKPHANDLRFIECA